MNTQGSASSWSLFWALLMHGSYEVRDSCVLPPVPSASMALPPSLWVLPDSRLTFNPSSSTKGTPLPIKSDFFPLNSYSSNCLLAILHLALLLPNTKVILPPLESILTLNQKVNSWVRMYITTTTFQKSFTYACPAIPLLGIYPQEIIKDV